MRTCHVPLADATVCVCVHVSVCVRVCAADCRLPTADRRAATRDPQADDTLNTTWKYVLLVNTGSKATIPVAVDYVELGLTPTATCAVQDLWHAKALGPSSRQLVATLKPHASLLARLSDCN